MFFLEVKREKGGSKSPTFPPTRISSIVQDRYALFHRDTRNRPTRRTSRRHFQSGHRASTMTRSSSIGSTDCLRRSSGGTFSGSRVRSRSRLPKESAHLCRSTPTGCSASHRPTQVPNTRPTRCRLHQTRSTRPRLDASDRISYAP